MKISKLLMLVPAIGILGTAFIMPANAARFYNGGPYWGSGYDVDRVLTSPVLLNDAAYSGYGYGGACNSGLISRPGIIEEPVVVERPMVLERPGCGLGYNNRIISSPVVSPCGAQMPYAAAPCTNRVVSRPIIVNHRDGHHLLNLKLF